MKTRLFLIALLAHFLLLTDYTLYAQVITVTSPGNLINQIDLNSVSEIQNLTLHGEINGSDIRVINRLTNLEILDLSEARIVSGGGAYLEKYATEDNVIGNRMFQSCTNLTNILLPRSTLIIRDYAFNQMSKLEDVKIPDSVTAIGSYAFDGCSSITSITLPKKLEALGEMAFADCSNLESITFQSGIINMGFWAFYSCYNMKEVHIKDLYGWCNSSISTVGSTSNNYSNPLYYAQHLYLNGEEVTNLVIPEDVQDVKAYTFENCSGFTTIRINDNVKSIGKFSFNNCNNVTDIYVYSINPPTIQSNTFNKALTQTATLHVPKGFKNNFWLADYWTNFTNIVDDLDVQFKLMYVLDGQEYRMEKYYPGEMIAPLSALEKEGYTFSGWSEIPETMPAKDVIVNGSFTINNYRMKFLVDGELYQEEILKYGAITHIKHPLITSESQLTSPWSDPNEGCNIGALIDENNDTFWHTSWHFEPPHSTMGSHFLQVEMPNGYYDFERYKEIVFKCTRRNTDDNHPIRWAVYGTNNPVDFENDEDAKKALWNDPMADRDNCTLLAEITTELTSFGKENANGETHVSEPFDPKGFKYLRFYVDETQSTNGGEANAVYWHTAEIQLYPAMWNISLDAPLKEGYTFSGWSEIPDSMPAHNVTITGSFKINKYKLTYVVDGKEYKVDSVDFATKLEAEPIPEKEGYTFSGWSEVLDSMPARDVTINGHFTINSYIMTYLVDGEKFKEHRFDYNASILFKEPVTDNRQPLITDVSQFSSPMSDAQEGNFYSLLGKRYECPADQHPGDDFWHSDWHNGTPLQGSHYFQVEMPDGLQEIVDLRFQFTRRDTPKNHTTEWSVRGTNDFNALKEDCEELLYAYTPFASQTETLISQPFAHKGYKYLRFYSEAQVANNNNPDPGFFHLSRFQLYPDSVLAPNLVVAKEGHTFDGWFQENGDTIPDKMLARDVTVSAKFTPNKYRLTYLVDERVHKADSVVFATKLIAEKEPEKEGYTFSGWSEIPDSMPANDVTITGKFTINKYKLTYTVDGEEYKSFDINYGSTIIAEDELEREGYTFSGWSEIPETMPARDVTITGSFKVNKYLMSYIVDEEVYKTDSIAYGSKLTAEVVPEKEGYSFSGWSEIPDSMPARDVSVTGSFTINSYKLTYLLNGEVYKSDSIVYATPLTAEPAIEQEGYTFSGWSEIPDSMPAKDVTVTATLKVNTYTITYLVDGYEYKAIRLDYGTALTAEEAPEKKGYSFSGWSEIPETMPAKDVTVTGTFSINSYMLTYEVDGEEYKTYTIRYASTIIPISEPTKEGYTFSGWSEIPEEMPAHDVTITGTFTVNKYKVRYYVGEQLWAEDEVDYGAKLTLRDYTPEDANRYSFAGWDGEKFETMPAYDIEYRAMIVDGISGLNADTNGIEAIYDGTGRKLSKMQRGVNVLRMKDGTTRKVFR